MTFSMLGTKRAVFNRGVNFMNVSQRLDRNKLSLLINYFIQESDQLTLH